MDGNCVSDMVQFSCHFVVMEGFFEDVLDRSALSTLMVANINFISFKEITKAQVTRPSRNLDVEEL